MDGMTQILATEREAGVADLLQGWDHLEWWVGNARAMTQFLVSGFGFRCTAYAGPETGAADRASYVLEQGDVRFVVTAALSPDSPIAMHVLAHGDGLRHLAWRVDDAREAFDRAVRHGATAVGEPLTAGDDDGALTTATVATYGQTRHVFVDRSGYGGLFAPGYTAERLPASDVGPAVGLSHIDHVVGNVEEGRLDEWVRFYESVFGFSEMRHFDADQISTEFSALRSSVMWNGGRVVMPLNEPAPGRRTSQIQEYLDTYGGPGVQHIALATNDIVTAVSALAERGVRFLTPPPTYYDDVRQRCGHLELPWAAMERLGILVDTDTGGYLLQVFTENMTDRPTVFLEIIERRGATGFGDGNFKALFEAIEREQARRGHL
jgi:4-hydroxyphenylpyruvate dioxygenase